MNKLITSILVCCFAFNLYAEQLPAKQFSHPERIRYDQHCFTIEGRDIFILSAAFHYFRVPQELWRDRFRKIKEAGSTLWRLMCRGIGMSALCRVM